MTRKVQMTLHFLILLFGLAAAAGAQEHGCVGPGMTGTWAYSETGTVMVPSPNGPVAVVAIAVGTYEFDDQGNFSGKQYSSAGGTVSEDAKVGTYVVNDDCTAVLTLQVWDPARTTLRRNSVWAVVLESNATALRGIMISMALPNGMALSPIMSMTAKRLDHGPAGFNPEPVRSR